ncbi:MAG: ABC transporter substrate-binding protein [Bacteroidales bacterium]|nr:ABC transporter substrate-binding protein [Bacteroidales bacterium]
MKLIKTDCLFVMIAFSILALASCSSNDVGNKRIKSGDKLELSYAKGFDIRLFDNYKIIDVFNPWNGAQDVVYSYILSDSKDMVPDSVLSVGDFIQTPVKRVVCMATTQIGFLSVVSEEPSVVGLSGGQYVYSDLLGKKFRSGKIVDVGYESELNYETHMQLNADLTFMYGVDARVTSTIDKFKRLKQKVVISGEYLEETPLAKAEWLLFFASFYNKEEQAKQYVDSIADIYNDIKRRAAKTDNKPNIMVGIPWKGIWYQPGGRSLTSKYIADAGANYVWSDNDRVESFAVSIEDAILKAKDADYWINTSSATTLNNIVETDKRLSDVGLFKQGNIFNNCNRLNSTGGNDYFESGVISPHLILRDLVNIFHPELLNDTTLVYYKELK